VALNTDQPFAAEARQIPGDHFPHCSQREASS
jgi:hypothetical protein